MNIYQKQNELGASKEMHERIRFLPADVPAQAGSGTPYAYKDEEMPHAYTSSIVACVPEPRVAQPQPQAVPPVLQVEVALGERLHVLAEDDDGRAGPEQREALAQERQGVVFAREDQAGGGGATHEEAGRLVSKDSMESEVGEERRGDSAAERGSVCVCVCVCVCYLVHPHRRARRTFSTSSARRPLDLCGHWTASTASAPSAPAGVAASPLPSPPAAADDVCR